MPDLPTITVTQEQADRMLAAFGSAAEYRAWLKSQIIAYVKMVEDRKLFDEYIAMRDSVSAQLDLELS